MLKKFKIIILLILLTLFQSVIYSETSVFLSFSPIPKGISNSDGDFLNSSVMENLQDLNDLLNNIYIKSDTLEKLANTKIDEINSTNTNVTIVNKKPVNPKKLPSIVLKPFNPAALKTLNAYVRLDSILVVNYTLNAAKGSPTNISINFTLQNNQGVKTASSAAIISQTKFMDTGYLNATIKKSIIDLYNLWNRYYYLPKKFGSVTFNILQKNAEIKIGSLNLKLVNGKNDKLPYGSYLTVITASNYQTLITNIIISDKTPVYKLSLITNKTAANTASALGNLLIDSDFPNAKFIIVEDDISGLTPMTLTNIKIGEKTVVFDETPEYEFKKMNTTVKENDTTYEFINLIKKGSGFRIECNSDDTLVILDKDIVGTVSNGIFDYSSSPGLHGLTFIKDKYEALRTNINLKADSNENIKINLIPKNIAGYIVTPQVDGVEVLNNSQSIGFTPAIIYLQETNNISLNLVATNSGFNNLMINMPWKWGSDNNYTAVLKPLFGDLKIITSQDDVSVVVENSFKGKASTNGISLLDIPSRRIKLRLEKDGYKTINTNIYISPNIENKYNFELKEAPSKAFITSSPEKGLDIFINGEYSGVSGEGVVSIEMGKLNIKLKKKGFKTIQTNIDVTGKESLILNFSTVPGVGEDEFIENINESYSQALKLLDKNSFDNALSNFISIKSNIQSSDYKDLVSIKDIADKIDVKIKWLNALGGINDLISAGDESYTRDDLDASELSYENAIKLMDSSGALENSFYSEKKKDLEFKIENIKKGKEDKETADQARQFISKINPVIYESDKLAENFQFTQAIEKYNEALKMIDDFPLKDNQKLKDSRERIEKRLKRAQLQAKERDVWWPKMVRNWTGLSFDVMGSMISSPGMSFDSKLLNIPVFARLGIHIAPVFGLTFGGMYNVSYGSSDLTNKYAPYAVMAGAILRVPIFPQLSAFGEYQLLLSDFQSFNLIQYGIVNIGVDAKSTWIGIKVFYQLAFASSYQVLFNGLGLGISFWITEE